MLRLASPAHFTRHRVSGRVGPRDHASVTSRMDYCNASKSVTDELQRVGLLLLSNTHKHDRGLSHSAAHRAGLTFLSEYSASSVELCIDVCRVQSSWVSGGVLHSDLWHFLSAIYHQLFIPRHRCSILGRQAFSVAGPMACNSSPDTALSNTFTW